MGELVTVDGNGIRDKFQNFPWENQFLRSKILVAYVNNNELIGACGIRGWFNHLVILDRTEYRNKGIGKLLLERLSYETKSKGIGFITLTVPLDLEVALHLYSKLGFEGLTWHTKGNRKYLIMFSASRVYKPVFYFFRIILSTLPEEIISKTIEAMKGSFDNS
jgi:GNAT superfamily N-acetyltransferase